jgi:hypothetical protein
VSKNFLAEAELCKIGTYLSASPLQVLGQDGHGLVVDDVAVGLVVFAGLVEVDLRLHQLGDR